MGKSNIRTRINARGAFGVVSAGALGGLVASTIALPTAFAQPQCTASGLSNAIGTVASATGQFLAANPGANEAITTAGALPPAEAENSIRAHFVANPLQWAELQRIAGPLRDLRQQCEVDVAPAQIARLYDAMAA